MSRIKVSYKAILIVCFVLLFDTIFRNYRLLYVIVWDRSFVTRLLAAAAT